MRVSLLFEGFHDIHKMRKVEVADCRPLLVAGDII